MAIAMATGAAAGAAAVLAQMEGVQPRMLDARKVQNALAEQMHAEATSESAQSAASEASDA